MVERGLKSCCDPHGRTGAKLSGVGSPRPLCSHGPGCPRDAPASVGISQRWCHMWSVLRFARGTWSSPAPPLQGAGNLASALLYLYVFIHIYLQRYKYICVYERVCIDVYRSVNIFLYIRVELCIHMCVSPCAQRYIFVYIVREVCIYVCE